MIIINKWICWVASGRLSWDQVPASPLVALEPNWSIMTSEALGNHVTCVPIWLPSGPRQAGRHQPGLNLMLPWGSIFLLHRDYNPDMIGLRKASGKQYEQRTHRVSGCFVFICEPGPGAWQHSAVSQFQEDLQSNLLLYWVAVSAVTTMFIQDSGLKNQGSLVFYL